MLRAPTTVAADRGTLTPARVLGLAVVALALAACPETRPVPTECTRLGEQCRMPDGPLGVCSQTSGNCAQPPCFACTSQH